MQKRQTLLSAFVVAVIFTALDSLVHFYYEPLEIYTYPVHYLGIQSAPMNYALSKLVSSTALLFGLNHITSKLDWNEIVEHQIIILVVVILLEVRYIVGGYYTPQWHVLNVINHYVTLSVGVFVVAKLFQERMRRLPTAGPTP